MCVYVCVCACVSVLVGQVVGAEATPTCDPPYPTENYFYHARTHTHTAHRTPPLPHTHINTPLGFLFYQRISPHHRSPTHSTQEGAEQIYGDVASLFADSTVDFRDIELVSPRLSLFLNDCLTGIRNPHQLAFAPFGPSFSLEQGRLTHATLKGT